MILRMVETPLLRGEPINCVSRRPEWAQTSVLFLFPERSATDVRLSLDCTLKSSVPPASAKNSSFSHPTAISVSSFAPSRTAAALPD